MTVFHDLKLEIVRPGTPHNQLLSPLTLYTALCGESAPVTFSIELEQHQLLDRISRLRYLVRDGQETRMVPEKTRQAAVNDMGQVVGQILAKLQNLLFEQGRALGQAISDQNSKRSGEHMVHLRLVSSASELANIPFEMAISPAASPAEGKRMLLDLNLPMVLTREIRRTRPIPISWDRKMDTKILVVAAQPGFLTVPLKNHVRALRKSLEPWVGWGTANTADKTSDRVREALKRIRILKDASIKSICEICSQESFTHVHILAHGGVLEEAGEKRFGLVLCDPADNAKPHHVSGTTLAKALQAEHLDGTTRSSPAMVTLATCDSGAQGSVLVPGGSLAYDLHVAGIPWVIASQFPLSKRGSTIMTRELYPRIWRGDDPRKALFEVRRILFTRLDQMHDWASLVIYASLPHNFDAQVTQFFESQTKAAINTAMKRADDIAKAVTGEEEKKREGAAQPHDKPETTLELRKEIEFTLKKVEQYLRFWEKRLPTGKDMASRISRTEFHGISGSVYKRIALLYTAESKAKKNSANGGPHNYMINLRKAISCYKRALDQWATDESRFHWVATQYLSLKAVLYWATDENQEEIRNRYAPDDRDNALYEMAKELAKRDLQSADADFAKAWSCGTLAELEMLALHYKRAGRRNYSAIKQKVKSYCADLIEYVGIDDFAVSSTRRQFYRYKLYWGNAGDGELRRIASEAVSTLKADDQLAQ